MIESYKISFASLLGVIFLLPLFFVPATVLPLGIAKIAILGLGSIIVFLAFLYETLREGKLSLPSTYLLWGAIALPLVYLLSSVTSIAPKVSFFGYNLEIGTFGSIVFISILLGVSAVVFSSISRVLKAYTVLLLSLSILTLFGLVKLFSGGSAFNLGAFSGVMGNPIGAWTDYAIAFGLIAVISLFAIEMLYLKGAYKIYLYIMFAVSMFFLAVINFQSAWFLVFGASLIALVYFMTVEKRLAQVNPDHESVLSKRGKLVAPIIAVVVSLIFMINPVVSGTSGTIGNTISNQFGVNNTDVQPSLPTTIDVSKSVLKNHAILGSGPNTFDRDWLLNKPNAINGSQFWNTTFPFGFGFVPTQLATTGILGSLVWLLMIVFFLLLGARAFTKTSWNTGERFSVMSSFIGSLFLWSAIFLYVPSAVILGLAFIFTGIFIASSRITGLIPNREVLFSKNIALNFAAVLLMIVLGIGATGLGLVSFQRIASVIHFEKALALSNKEGSTVESIETELGKASNLTEQDIYYSALSQIEFARAQAALSSATGTPEQNKQAFETAISRSIAGAQSAANLNPGSYQNWVSLGSLYAALVPKPLAVPGAYDSAKAAYLEAIKRNPESPEVPLLLARLEIDNGNIDLARTHIQEAIAKKADYADAYFLLTQLEASQNNLPQAIKSAETSAILSPSNAGVFFELGVLKYANKDYNGALQALGQALRILPDYANAKYYFGLSLDLLGRKADAITVFEDLAKTNPDNQTVAQILSNLRAGKPALTETPAQKKTASKASLPIPTTAAPAR